MKSTLVACVTMAAVVAAACGDGPTAARLASAPVATPAPEIEEEEEDLVGEEEEEFEPAPAPEPSPTPRPAPPVGGGVVLYDVVGDVTSGDSPSPWLSEISAHSTIRYIYPDFVWVDSLSPQGSTPAETPCTEGKLGSGGQWSYFAVQGEGSAKICVPGDQVTEAYASEGHLVLPFVDISCGIRLNVRTCATGKAPTANELGDCAAASSSDACAYPDIDGQLTAMAEALAGAANADPNAGGLAFDDEGPPFPQPYAQTFFTSVARSLDAGKHLALWRGAQVFVMNPGDPHDDSAMLMELRDLGAFIVASFYDIGTETEIGQLPATYGERFGLFFNPGRCHGCTGSIGFLERVIATTQIPFQVGLPASASTNEWTSVEAFNAPYAPLDAPPFETTVLPSCGYADESAGPVCTLYTLPGATQAAFLREAFDVIDALKTAPIDGVLGTCETSPFADDRRVACPFGNAASTFCGSDVPCTGPSAGVAGTPGYAWSDFADTFIGLFLYAIRPADTSLQACERKWNPDKPKTCFGEYPQFIDGPASTVHGPSADSAWAAYDAWAASQ